MEYFYFLFSIKETSYNIWTEDNGLVTGFIILMLVSSAVSAIYYLVLAKKNIKFATMNWWWLFQFVNTLLVFLLSIVLVGKFVFPESDSFLSIPGEVYIFSILNCTIYSGFFFLVFSLVFNNFSVNPRYVPFNILRKLFIK